MESTKAEVKRRYSKYVFLDVVRFSTYLAEPQSEIVSHLNEIVLAAVSQSSDEYERDCLFIPTGDGVCIAFVSPELPYDVHIQTSLRILEALYKHNEALEDEARTFQVRIGINQNTDILVIDINKKPNVAGAGINQAARIMDKADGGQILVSQTVYEELHPSEKYNGKFQHFYTTDKHGLSFRVYQFIGEGFEGLNTNTPSEFQKKEPDLDKEAALYLVIALRHRNKVLELKGRISHIDVKATVLFWFLMKEEDYKSGRGEFDSRTVRWKVTQMSFEEQLEYMDTLDFTLLLDIFELIAKSLKGYKDCFEKGKLHDSFLFPNEHGKTKLEREQPQIWQQYGLRELFAGQKESSPEGVMLRNGKQGDAA